MAKLRGGMEFRGGRAVRFAPPAERVPAQPLRLTCAQRPEVITGQTVRAGQVLTDPAEPAEPCQLCPITGTVRRVTAWRNAGQRRYDVEIHPGMDTESTALEIDPPHQTVLTEWFAALRRAGPWAQDGLKLGLIGQLEQVKARPPDALICIGLDRFPPYPDRSSLLQSFAEEAALGVQLLGGVTGAKSATMVIGRAARLMTKLRPICRNFNVRLKCLDNVYPQADPTLVLWQHSSGKRRLAHGADPMQQGVMLITPWTAIRIARWLTHGRLDVVHPLMIAWPKPGAALTPHWVFTGQALASVESALAGDPDALAGRAVLGHPMTGRSITSPRTEAGALPPVTPHDEHLVTVLSPASTAQPEPCISCGWCVDVCPTRLRPIHLMELAERRVDDGPAGPLNWCVDCGLCTHVCPSRLPLAQSLRQARGQVKE